MARLSGILQPVFSLRSAHDVGVGDFEAFDPLFGWMRQASQKLVMVLPLLPTTPGDPSPYSTKSAFGLNPLFIHLGWLPEGVRFTDAEQKAIDAARASPTVRYDLVFPVKTAALERAFAAFQNQGSTARSREFDGWCHAQREWLDGYALAGDLASLAASEQAAQHQGSPHTGSVSGGRRLTCRHRARGGVAIGATVEEVAALVAEVAEL